MTKNILYFFIFPFILSCSVGVEQAFERENFDPNKEYEPLSLQYNGHPIFSIGQKVKTIDSLITYKKNTSDKYHHSPKNITDYISTDSNLTIWIDTSYVAGSIQFSVDNTRGRVFRTIGYWTFNFPNDSLIMNELKTQFSSKFFPVLKNSIQFKKSWNKVITHPNFKENFKLKLNKKLNLWVLSYEVKLNN